MTKRRTGGFRQAPRKSADVFSAGVSPCNQSRREIDQSPLRGPFFLSNWLRFCCHFFTFCNPTPHPVIRYRYKMVESGLSSYSTIYKRKDLHTRNHSRDRLRLVCSKHHMHSSRMALDLGLNPSISSTRSHPDMSLHGVYPWSMPNSLISHKWDAWTWMGSTMHRNRDGNLWCVWHIPWNSTQRLVQEVICCVHSNE